MDHEEVPKKHTRMHTRRLSAPDPPLAPDFIDALTATTFDAVVLTAREGPWLSAELWRSFVDADDNPLEPREYRALYVRTMQKAIRAIRRLQPGVPILIFGPSPTHSVGGSWHGSHDCHPSSGPLPASVVSENVAIFADLLQQAIAGVAGNLSVGAVGAGNTSRGAAEHGPPVVLLNVTHLSGYRADAHPSNVTRARIGGKRQPDCRHWCLPGVLDTWVQVLLTYLCHRDGLVNKPWDEGWMSHGWRVGKHDGDGEQPVPIPGS